MIDRNIIKYLKVMSDDNESIVMIVELTKELSNILEGVHIQS